MSHPNVDIDIRISRLVGTQDELFVSQRIGQGLQVLLAFGIQLLLSLDGNPLQFQHTILIPKYHCLDEGPDYGGYTILHLFLPK